MRQIPFLAQQAWNQIRFVEVEVLGNFVASYTFLKGTQDLLSLLK